MSESTRRTYTQGQCSFNRFCNQFNIAPYPLQEYTLRLFTAHLSHNLSYSTIQTYLAAIRHRNIELGFPSTFDQMPLLRLLLRGVKRIKGSTTRPKRLPISLNTLKLLKTSLRESSFNTQDQHMLWAAFTTAFFGFLRSSEFCCPSQNSFNPVETLLTRDVSLSSTSASMHLKISKTDSFRNGHIICFAASGTSVCPFRALQHHLCYCPDPDKPLFSFSDNTFLTRQSLCRTLNNLLPASLNANFSSHSFRIGAATTAAAANVPDWLIKVLGRWSSDCYQTYIRTPSTTINAIPAVLARNVAQPSTTWCP